MKSKSMGQKGLSTCLGLEIGEATDCKWAQGTYWGDGNI